MNKKCMKQIKCNESEKGSNSALLMENKPDRQQIYLSNINSLESQLFSAKIYHKPYQRRYIIRFISSIHQNISNAFIMLLFIIERSHIQVLFPLFPSKSNSINMKSQIIFVQSKQSSFQSNFPEKGAHQALEDLSLSNQNHENDLIKRVNRQEDNYNQTYSQKEKYKQSKNNEETSEKQLGECASDFVGNKLFARKNTEKMSKNLTAQLKNNSQRMNKQQFKMSRVLKNKFRMMKKCEICEQEMREENMGLTVCAHKSNFCRACVNQYVIFKIQKFEEVVCPHENCPQLLDIDGSLFRNLPLHLQTKYNKIHSAYQILQDPSLKPCSKQNCLGIIHINQDVCFCSLCKTEFCKKCLFEVHEGTCDDHEIVFFQSNFHYRQCSKCKMVVQRIEGCNHMTCRCKNEFCYECGQGWSNEHVCGVRQETFSELLNARILECQQQQCTGSCWLCALIKFPFKMFLLMLWVVLNSFNLVFQIFAIVAVLLMTIFLGMFAYSFQYACSLDCPKMLILIVFFPIAMLVGIALAIQQIFWDFLVLMARQFCSSACDCLFGIYDC